MRPPLIIEELGRQLFLRLLQSLEHFLAKAAQFRLEIGEPELVAEVLCSTRPRHASFASRIPVNGQRALAGKKLR